MSSRSLGIVGLPNVGKSTLFTALTNRAVDAENYPFCTIDPTIGVVPVPDERLQKLYDFSDSADMQPAAFEFVDIAGLVAGAHEGEGLGNQFLAAIREVDAIAHMVRIFADESVTHVHGDIDPLKDIEVINRELIQKDIATIEGRLEQLNGQARTGETDARELRDFLTDIKEALTDGRLISELDIPNHGKERELLDELHLLTDKQVLYVLNKKSDGTNLDEEGGRPWNDLMDYFDTHDAKWVTVDAQLEKEMREMTEHEKQVFRTQDNKSGVNDLITAGLDLLNLLIFYTMNENETRGWTMQDGATAPEAAGRIHSDFQENFIKARVIQWDALLEAGSYKTAREDGALRTEGSDYVVQDGDVIEFLDG